MPKDVSKAPKRQRNIILASSSVARCRDTDDVVPEASHAAPIYKHGVKHSLIHLSQWHVCEFTDAAGHKFRSVRQWVKWRKASVFDDTATADAILAAKTADSHTTLGRNANVRGFDQATWNAMNFSIVEEGNYLKFSQNPVLRANLLMREDADLVEAARIDRLWATEFRRPPSAWDKNTLFKALVSVRDRLRKEEAERERVQVHHAGSVEHVNQAVNKESASQPPSLQNKSSPKCATPDKAPSGPAAMLEVADAPRVVSPAVEEPVTLTDSASLRKRAFKIAEAHEKLSDRELVAAQLVFEDTRNVDQFLEYSETRKKARMLFLKLKVKDVIHQVPDESDEDLL